ncbi:MAG TPA: FtsQ-type POTRA domain-containing protein [Terriglobales bacterium]|nr:FtsQ-type POTRA domain-containing protein [Terriglobales bacterium]
MARDEGFIARTGRSPVPARGRYARPADESGEDEFPRELDLDAEEESPFLRAEKRIPVRRAPLPRRTADRLKQMLMVLTLVGLVSSAVTLVYGYGARSARFRMDSADHIEIAGIEKVAPAQVLAVFRSDIGRQVFSVPLEERKKELQEISWVESATVMRLLPDRIKVEVRERTPVAFTRTGSRIALVDGAGVIMEMPPGRAAGYSFPVILGMNENEPLSTRAARMKIYDELVRDLDSEGGNYSRDLSEVDLSDPEDVKVLVADPAGAVLIHLGSAHYLKRYKVYIAHAAEWRQQFQKLESVDLRYDRQIIVNPDSRSTSPVKSAAPPKPTVQTSRTATRKGKR